MADQFVGEIRIVPFNFAVTGWAMCDGQLISISQNTALFSLLGTFYGGNGTSNFALPNLQGRVAMDYGSGIGLTPRSLGEIGGSQTETLLTSEMPQHIHNIGGDSSAATSTTPTGNLFAVPPTPPRRPAIDVYKTGALTSPIILGNFIGLAGGNQPHNNLQPYLTLTYIIAMQGIFPARS